MVRISGFFCSHADTSFNTIVQTIEEARSIFSHEGKNVVIKEHFPFPMGSLEFAKRIQEFQKLSQEVFTRSAMEKDLFKLGLECEQKTQHERSLVRSLRKDQIRQYALLSNNYNSSLVYEFSELRRTVDFQWLYESGTTPEIDALVKQRHSILAKLNSGSGGDFEAHVDDSAEELRITGVIGSLREKLIHRKINDLMMAQHTKLNIQVVFGSAHKNMLDQYQKRADVSTRVIVLDEPGFSFILGLCDALDAGKVITTDQKLALYYWRNLVFFSTLIHRDYGITVSPGDFFDATPQPLTGPQIKLFFGLDKEGKLIAMARLLREVGVFDALGSKNPKAADFLRTLADKPTVEADRKLLVQAVGRNRPCPCGSGKKYKKCCGK